MHNKINKVVQIKNPIEFKTDDEIRMYLNGPNTSSQLKSLHKKKKKQTKF